LVPSDVQYAMWLPYTALHCGHCINDVETIPDFV